MLRLKKISIGMQSFCKAAAICSVVVCFGSCATETKDVDDNNNPPSADSNKSDSRIPTLQSQLSSREAELRNKEAELAQAKSSTRIPDLEAKVVNLETEITSKDSEIAQIKQEKETLEAEKTALSAKIDDANEKVKEVNERLIIKQNEMDVLAAKNKTEIDNKVLDIKQKGEEIEQLKNKSKELCDELATAKTSLEELRKPATGAEKNALVENQLRAKIDSLQANLVTKDKEIKKLGDEKKAIESEKTNATTALNTAKTELKNKINVLENQLNTLQSEKNNLTQGINQKNAEITILNGNVKELTDDKTSVNTELTKVKGELRTEKEKLKTAEDEKTTAENKLKKKEEELKKANKAKEEAENAKKEAQEAEAKAKQDLEEAKKNQGTKGVVNKLRIYKYDLKEKIKKKKLEIEQNKGLHLKFKNELDIYSNNQDQDFKDIQVIKNEIKGLKKNAVFNKEKIIEKDTLINEKEGKRNSFIKELELRLVNKNEKLSNLENELDTDQKSLDELLPEIDSAKETDIDWLTSSEKLAIDNIYNFSKGELKRDEIEYALECSRDTLGGDKKIKAVNTLYNFNDAKKYELFEKSSTNKSMTNFHALIDGKPNLLTIVKMPGQSSVFGAFSDQPTNNTSGCKPGKGAILRLDGASKDMFPLKNKGPITGDLYYLNYGNAELRLKSGENTVMVNFGIANSYFDNKGKTCQDALGIKVGAPGVEFENYYIVSLETE